MVEFKDRKKQSLFCPNNFFLLSLKVLHNNIQMWAYVLQSLGHYLFHFINNHYILGKIFYRFSLWICQFTNWKQNKIYLFQSFITSYPAFLVTLFSSFSLPALVGYNFLRCSKPERSSDVAWESKIPTQEKSSELECSREYLNK